MKIFKFFNSGNNCYINSSLQVLLKLNHFNSDLMKIYDNIKDKNTLLHQYITLVKLYFNLNIEDETLLNPHGFYKFIHNKLNFQTKQQDINEFFLLFFDFLEKEIKQHFKTFEINNYFNFNNEYSIICKKCQKVIKRNEKYLMMDIYIKKYEKTLQELIDEEHKNKKLPGYKCDGCNKKNTCEKYNNFNNFKDFVFLYICSYNKRSKVPFNRDFKINNIIIINNVKFKPVCIINHSGSLGGGHYYNHLINFAGKWKYISDSNLSNNIQNLHIYPVFILLKKI
jgi:uncharacterized UBP type Zn finger protein